MIVKRLESSAILGTETIKRETLEHLAKQKCSTKPYSPVRNLDKNCKIKYWLLPLKLVRDAH